MSDTRQLLEAYAQNGSETAFRELTSRYVDLVYSAAFRLVNGDAHTAQDITQTVFADLARKATRLTGDVMLGGWLHRHTCFVAANTLRRERRRLARERQAVEMNAIEDHSAANLAQVTPVLDEAINQLSAEDRAAILLRFFEQKDFQAVGAALGSNEDAARKRVSRAVDKLHSMLTKRGVTLSVGALGTFLAGQAVSAAPAGLAVTVSTFALTTAAAGGGTTLTVLKIMSMTKLKAGIVGAVVVAGIAVPWTMQHQANRQLADVNETLRRQSAENSQLAAENERLRNELALVQKTSAPSQPEPSKEMLRLRGEVGRLRQEVAASATKSNGPSAISSLASDPNVWKMIRDQQKMGMSAVYKEFTNRVSLPPGKAEAFVDLLADNVMDGIQNVTTALRDNFTPAQMEQLFSQQEAALKEKVRELLGPEALAQYEDYTRNVASMLTSEQFKNKFSGTAAEKDAKAAQLRQLMQDETQRVLAREGLPADFQTVPTLEFRNIVSEAAGERTLKVLDAIYAEVFAHANSFLSPEELTKFAEFRTNAISSSRVSLSINRKMMSPAGQ